MNKVAFIRSIEIQQTAPYLMGMAPFLKERGIEARLFYTDGTCGPSDFPGSSQKLNQEADVEAIVQSLRDWGADGAVSLSIPDENSIRDAQIKRRLATLGIPMITHDPLTTYLFANKWETKQTVSKYGLSTAPGFLLDGDLINNRALEVRAYKDFVRQQCESLGYPVLTKPLWDCLGNGIQYLLNEDDLLRFLETPYDGNCVVEKFLHGELCSVEVIGQDQRLLFQPLIWKGKTKATPSFPFTQVRHSLPRPDAEQHFASTAAHLRRMCSSLLICGSLEVEMVYSDGTYHIIEINPRVSGSTSLSIASSSTNTYEALLHMLCGSWSEICASTHIERSAVAIQFPFIRAKDEGHPADGKIVRSSTFTINNERYDNAIIRFLVDEIGDIPTWAFAHYDLTPDVASQIAALTTTPLSPQQRERVA